MLPALHTLLLPGNYVASLADCPVGSFTCLELLDLSFNALQSDCLPILGQWPQLRQLDVSGTSISLNGTVLTGFAQVSANIFAAVMLVSSTTNMPALHHVKPSVFMLVSSDRNTPALRSINRTWAACRSLTFCIPLASHAPSWGQGKTKLKYIATLNVPLRYWLDWLQLLS